MKILNFGSLNLDYVYSVDHMVNPGETLLVNDITVFPGGKGLNQSIALARAGISVYHAGAVGEDGQLLLNVCKENGISTDYIQVLPMQSGHTIIQVDKEGQNSILLFGGSNQSQTKEAIEQTLANFGKEDILLLQNEINHLDYIIDTAYEKGMTIVLNPSPYNSVLDTCDLAKISLFFVNEIEAEQMTGETDIDKMKEKLLQTFPAAGFVLTLGENGSMYFDADTCITQPIFPTNVVDTTAAGDTFTGYFLAATAEGRTKKEALEIASKASSIAVSRNGASTSVPWKNELVGTGK